MLKAAWLTSANKWKAKRHCKLKVLLEILKLALQMRWNYLAQEWSQSWFLW